MTTAEVVDRPGGSRHSIPTVPVLAMLAYPAFIGWSVGSAFPLLSITATLVAFVAAIYLFSSLPVLSFNDQRVWLAFGAAGGAALGVVTGGIENLWFTLLSWLAVVVPGIVTGHLIKREQSCFRVFLGGLLLLALLATFAWTPTWLEFQALGAKVSDEMVKSLFGGFDLSKYSAEEVAQMTEAYKMMAQLWFRLIPASTIIMGITQFSLGFLWLTWRFGPAHPVLGQVRRFTEWKVPFGVTPVLGIAIVARLLGQDAVKLIADNLLLVLAIFYATCGLSFMEHTLKRVQVSMVIRILFYVLLTLTHVAGIFMMVLIGFVDSFLDWRKPAGNATVEQ